MVWRQVDQQMNAVSTCLYMFLSVHNPECLRKDLTSMDFYIPFLSLPVATMVDDDDLASMTRQGSSSCVCVSLHMPVHTRISSADLLRKSHQWKKITHIKPFKTDMQVLMMNRSCEGKQKWKNVETNHFAQLNPLSLKDTWSPSQQAHHHNRESVGKQK